MTLVSAIIFITGLIIKNKLFNMIIDYFYLKFYNGILKSSIPEFPRFMASFVFGVLLSVNMLTLNALLAKIDILPYLFDKSTSIGSLIIIVVIIYLRYKKSRTEAIILLFSAEEFKTKKKIFNIIFILWVTLSMPAVILVAFYKPGYLPKLNLF